MHTLTPSWRPSSERAPEPLPRSIASEYRSLEALRADAAVPPSLLPELERLWQSSRTPGAPAPPLIPLEALIAMGEWEYDDVGY